LDDVHRVVRHGVADRGSVVLLEEHFRGIVVTRDADHIVLPRRPRLTVPHDDEMGVRTVGIRVLGYVHLKIPFNRVGRTKTDGRGTQEHRIMGIAVRLDIIIARPIVHPGPGTGLTPFRHYVVGGPVETGKRVVKIVEYAEGLAAHIEGETVGDVFPHRHCS
jgi:hypothetical protein